VASAGLVAFDGAPEAAATHRPRESSSASPASRAEPCGAMTLNDNVTIKFVGPEALAIRFRGLLASEDWRSIKTARFSSSAVEWPTPSLTS
jgi:hypothetical protein